MHQILNFRMYQMAYDSNKRSFCVLTTDFACLIIVSKSTSLVVLYPYKTVLQDVCILSATFAIGAYKLLNKLFLI